MQDLPAGDRAGMHREAGVAAAGSATPPGGRADMRRDDVGPMRRHEQAPVRRPQRPWHAQSRNCPTIALRRGVYAHHGAGGAPFMKSTTASSVSSTQGSWRWPVTVHKAR